MLGGWHGEMIGALILSLSIKSNMKHDSLLGRTIEDNTSIDTKVHFDWCKKNGEKNLIQLKTKRCDMIRNGTVFYR